MKEKHVHEYKTIRKLDVVANNPSYTIAERGTKAILIRECSCGDGVAFEYGDRETMAALINELSDVV